MKTIAIASGKGGSGKSTVTSALAVRATQESLRVALMDLNSDQGNLTQWWMMRGQPMNPRLVMDFGSVPEEVQFLSGNGWQWLFIDTPPAGMDLIEQAVVVADFVLVPVKASAFDVNAIEAVVSMCTAHQKPFAFVLMDVDAKFDKLNKQMALALADEGPLLTAQVSHKLASRKLSQAARAGRNSRRIWRRRSTSSGSRSSSSLGKAAPMIEQTSGTEIEDDPDALRKMRAAWKQKRANEPKAPKDSEAKARKDREHTLRATVDGRSLKATGRTEQFNFKCREGTKRIAIEAAKAKGMTIAEWMEHAIAAMAGRDEGA